MITSEPEFDSLKTKEPNQVYLRSVTALEQLSGTILTPLGSSEPPDLKGRGPQVCLPAPREMFPLKKGQDISGNLAVKG